MIERREFLKRGALFVGAVMFCPAKVIAGLPTPRSINDDFTITANGDIRWVGLADGPQYTITELYRWLDQQFSMELIIKPESTECLLVLNDPWNIDDTAAKFLREGSIVQEDCNVIYSGMIDWWK